MPDTYATTQSLRGIVSDTYKLPGTLRKDQDQHSQLHYTAHDNWATLHPAPLGQLFLPLSRRQHHTTFERRQIWRGTSSHGYVPLRVKKLTSCSQERNLRPVSETQVVSLKVQFVSGFSLVSVWCSVSFLKCFNCPCDALHCLWS